MHDTLVAQVPGQQSQLDADLSSTLAAIPDRAAKSAGVAAGKQQAASVLTERQGDGLDTASLDIPFTTPRHPDWLSGHGGVAGAAQQVLTAFLGRVAPAPISVTSPTDPGSTHTYNRWSQITREVIDARVWEGIHFRFSDVIGARVGSEVARYELRRLRSIGL